MRCDLLKAGAIMLAMLAGCREKPAEMEVSETRPLTSADQVPKLMATSQERFRGQGGGHGSGGGPTAPVKYGFTKPEGWEQKPGTSIRLLNFAVGPEGTGEVYVSQTRGDLLGNVARWRRQFGIADTSGEDLGKMPRVVVMEAGEGLLVEASGTYSPGMGRPDAPGQALAGVIAVLQGGGVFTVKMTGPEAVVKAERERFLEFCRTMTPTE
jgi:hypothetical protein